MCDIAWSIMFSLLYRKMELHTSKGTMLTSQNATSSQFLLMELKLPTALAVYLASFYVFNLAYPSTLKKTLTFIQKVILNIQDNVKIERSVVTRLERLNKHLDK